MFKRSCEKRINMMLSVYFFVMIRYNKTMKLTMIRHAQTRGNAEKRYLGTTESELTEVGAAQQAKALAHFEGTPIDAVYASPTGRTMAMAEELAQAKQLPVHQDDRLREMDFGIFDGLTAAEAEKKDSGVWKAWLADFDRYRLPEGESFQDLKTRFAAFWQAINRQYGDSAHVVLVTHGGVCRAALAVLCSLPDAVSWHVETQPASIMQIHMIGDYGVLCGLIPPDQLQVF